jgi:hypothetical protein
MSAKADSFHSPRTSRGGRGQFHEVEVQSASGERHVLRLDFPCSRKRLIKTLRTLADRIESQRSKEP